MMDKIPVEILGHSLRMWSKNYAIISLVDGLTYTRRKSITRIMRTYYRYIGILIEIFVE